MSVRCILISTCTPIWSYSQCLLCSSTPITLFISSLFKLNQSINQKQYTSQLFLLLLVSQKFLNFLQYEIECHDSYLYTVKSWFPRYHISLITTSLRLSGVARHQKSKSSLFYFCHQFLLITFLSDFLFSFNIRYQESKRECFSKLLCSSDFILKEFSLCNAGARWRHVRWRNNMDLTMKFSIAVSKKRI